MAITTTAGTRVYITASLPATDSLAAFQALGSYHEIGEVTDIGEISEEFETVQQVSRKSRATKTFKTIRTGSMLTLTMGRDSEDYGQDLLQKYNSLAVYLDNNVTAKIVHHDGTIFYGYGIISSRSINFGDVDTITSITIKLIYNSAIFDDLEVES